MSRVGSLVVGVDVGGTNTDAAVLFSPASGADPTALRDQLQRWAAALAGSGRAEEAEELAARLGEGTGGRGLVLGWTKRPTSGDVTAGVQDALRSVLGDVWSPADVDAVLVGTTHFVNAIVQRSADLSPVAVLRLCGAASHALPPFVSLPHDLATLIGTPRGHFHLAQGGLEIDGEQEIAALDEAEIRGFAGTCIDKGLHVIVVCGVFSPVSAQQELAAVQIVQGELERRLGKATARSFAVTPSHEVAHMGLLERESAAILNACVQPLAQRTVRALRHAMGELELTCPLFLVRPWPNPLPRHPLRN